MTTTTKLVLTCDKAHCDEQVVARTEEDPVAIRRRAALERGWVSTPSLRHGGHTDLCRMHG